MGKISSIIKNDDRPEVENNSPIGIIINFSKVFLYDYLFHHMKSSLSFVQHGFISSRSISSDIMCLTQYVASHLDKGGQIDVVYTKFSKAFDRCSVGDN